MSSSISDKSRGITLLLAALLGPFGGHRFYTGKVKSGILMACTLGGMGLWYLYDLIVIAGGGFKDSEGRMVLDWEFEQLPHNDIPDQLFQELDDVRRELAELQERVEFNERLLSNVRRNETDDQSSGMRDR